MRSQIKFLTIVMAILIGVNGYFVYRSVKADQSETVDKLTDQSFAIAQAYILPEAPVSNYPILDADVAKPVVTAKAALVYDQRSGRMLYEKNTKDRLPIASLTKVLSAVVVIENMNLDDEVVVASGSVRADGTKQDLYLDEKISAGNLLRFMLISSSNDAAFALAGHMKGRGMDFVELMNEKAQSLEMVNSKFIDPAGLNDYAYSTAEDMIKLVRYSRRYPVIWKILTEETATIKSVDGRIVHQIKNTDELLGVIPNIVGGKTGNTEGALGCLILLVDVPGKNDTLVSIVLGSKDRFGDTEKMVQWSQQAYRWD